MAIGTSNENVEPQALAIESLLASSLGRSVSVTGSDRLAPWALTRVHLSAGGRPHPSVIVKWLRNHPAGFRTDPSQILTEAAALRFLAEIGFEHAPGLVACDFEAGVLVLEDLTPAMPLAELLIAVVPEAEAGLRSFAATLGELHGATVGREAQYYRLRSTYGPVDPVAERLRFLGADWRRTPSDLEALGVRLRGEVEAELHVVSDLFAEPGPFLAFSNGDAGANNFMFGGAGGRLVDFEFAGFRLAFADAVCLYVPGPMWMTVSDPRRTGVEAEYRCALSSAVPEAEDDASFGLGVAAAALAFAVMRLARLAALDARPAGDDSRAQMVTTLERASDVAEAHAVLPHLRGWARRAAEVLRKRWPDTDIAFDTTSYLLRGN